MDRSLTSQNPIAPISLSQAKLVSAGSQLSFVVDCSDFTRFCAKSQDLEFHQRPLKSSQVLISFFATYMSQTLIPIFRLILNSHPSPHTLSLNLSYTFIHIHTLLKSIIYLEKKLFLIVSNLFGFKIKFNSHSKRIQNLWINYQCEISKSLNNLVLNYFYDFLKFFEKMKNNLNII